MQLKCEYCGAEVDTKNDKVCPFCGGSYEGNKEYEEKRAREEESKRIIMERRKLDLEQRRNEIEEDRIEQRRYATRLHREQHSARAGRSLAYFFIIVIISFILMSFFSIFTSMHAFDFIGADFSTPEVWDAPQDTYVSEDAEEVEYLPEEDEPVTVNFNEVAETSEYTIKCDGFEVIDRYPFEPAKNHQYVTFHFVVENVSDDRLDVDETIDCLVDGIMCQYQFDSERNEIPRYINKGITGAGNICFEVPINAEAFDIKYGEYVTIHIENTLEK